jgi:hypothetical protein
MKELIDLAKEFKISLVKKSILFGLVAWKQRASRKDEIIDVLLESRRLTKKKIEQYFRFYYYG